MVIRLQPNEGIELEMVSKKHSLRERLSTEKRVLNLDFNELESDKMKDEVDSLVNFPISTSLKTIQGVQKRLSIVISFWQI